MRVGSAFKASDVLLQTQVDAACRESLFFVGFPNTRLDKVWPRSLPLRCFKEGPADAIFLLVQVERATAGMGYAAYHEATVQKKCSRAAVFWWVGEGCLCFWVSAALLLGACGTAYGVAAWNDVQALKSSL